VARTRNPATHAVRRDAFVDVAGRLIATKGYEAFSVQDVLDELDASKGAFYHYFGSKGDVLEAVVERMADAVEASWGEVMARTDLTAAQRLQGVFETSAQYKNARRDLSLAILEAWLSDTNAVTRDKLRTMVRSRMSGVLATIIREGVTTGEFTATDPDGTANVVVALLLGGQEDAADLFVARQAGTIEYEAVERHFAAFSEALGRVLGLPGSLWLTDPTTLRLWFA
jgi:AcrR family transcriptional regulator